MQKINTQIKHILIINQKEFLWKHICNYVCIQFHGPIYGCDPQFEKLGYIHCVQVPYPLAVLPVQI